MFKLGDMYRISQTIAEKYRIDDDIYTDDIGIISLVSEIDEYGYYKIIIEFMHGQQVSFIDAYGGGY